MRISRLFLISRLKRGKNKKFRIFAAEITVVTVENCFNLILVVALPGWIPGRAFPELNRHNTLTTIETGKMDLLFTGYSRMEDFMLGADIKNGTRQLELLQGLTGIITPQR
jgi:hypothetical protein